MVDSIAFLRTVGFNKYNAKSNGESLLIHSYNTYFIVQKISKYIAGLSTNDIIKIELASLLHDYGKTYSEFQRRLHGPHKLKDGDIPLIRNILSNEVPGLDNTDIDDIIYIIQNHHNVNLDKADSKRGRLTRIVSVCDTIVSNENLSQEIINSLYALIDSVDYDIFTVELTEHPISSYAIGAFDYIYARNGIEPILFSKNGTLFIKKKEQKLPKIEDVNKFLNLQIDSVMLGSGGVIDFDRTNNRIYDNPENFLKLASQPDKFVEEAIQKINRRLASYKRYQKEKWTEDSKKVYLYGRVCGWIHDSIIELCNISEERVPKGGGGFADKSTVQFIEEKYGKDKSYTVIIRTILEKFSRDIQKALKPGNYDIKDLLIKDSSVINPDKIDIQKEAKTYYDKYWEKNPTKVCRVCHIFDQTTTTAALFPNSELGGKTDVFYTDLMRRSPELKEGGGICKWCLLWFALFKSKTGNRIYKLCVQPHGVFGRINWDDIFEADQIISIGNPREWYVYPHVAVTGLSGQNYSAFISKVVHSNGNGCSILDKLYENGLRGKVISTLIEPSIKLFECGGATIDASKYDILKVALKNVKASRKSNNFSLVVRAFNQKDNFGRDFLYAWGSLIKTNKLKEDKNMIKELGEKTGLSFLGAIWIGGIRDTKTSNADKVVRRVNETLRKLKDTENKDVVIDAMVAIGLKVAMSTRDFKTWQDERKQAEIDAFRKMAEKLYEYKDNSAQRTELVRSMAYYLAYIS